MIGYLVAILGYAAAMTLSLAGEMHAALLVLGALVPLLVLTPYWRKP